MSVKEIIKKLYRTHWRLLTSIIILSVLSIAVRVASPLFLKNVINYVQTVNTKQLIIWGSIFAVGTIASFILTSQNSGKIAKFGNLLTQSISKEAFSSYLRSEVLDANKIPSDQVVKRILNHTDEIGNKHYSYNLMSFFYQGILFVSLVITLLIINPWFGLATVTSIPVYYLISKQVTKILTRREEKVAESNQQILQMIKDTAHHLKGIKVLNGIAQEEERYQNLVTEYGKAQRQLEHIRYFNDLNISTLLSSIIMVGIVTIGGYFITQGYQNLGVLFASIVLLAEVYPSFRYVLSRMVHPKKIASLIAEVDEILAMKPENRADTVQQLDEIYSLKAKEVSFDYGPNTKFSLEDINFDLKKGERLGILGLSNSGKTTLTDLLVKIIRPKQGSILINNCDINKVNSYYLRELIACIPQQYSLIRGTFEQNITYPFPFDEYKYNDALNRCRLKPLINGLERKDQTIIDNDASYLNASDRQRLAIANAFYKDSKIYIFDDATSKMNPELEKDIIDEIYRLKNKIILLISNRIYNLLRCDKILILNNGRVVEYGKTSDLLENSKSTLARLVGEQGLAKISQKEKIGS